MIAPILWILGLGAGAAVATAGAARLQKQTARAERSNEVAQNAVQIAARNATGFANIVDSRFLKPIIYDPNATGVDNALEGGDEALLESRENIPVSPALEVISDLDRRFGPMLLNWLKTVKGLDGVAKPDDWPLVMFRRELAPLRWRSAITEVLSIALNPTGKTDPWGQDMAIDDATGELMPDFAAWSATYSINEDEVMAAIEARQPRPPRPGFWDSVWSGFTNGIKRLVTLDFKGAMTSIPANILGWVGSGFSPSSPSQPQVRPRPMSPEEVRIQKWLRNHFVAVPSFDNKMVQPWLLPMDLALCGLWPALDVIQSSFGGVEGFERALVLASVNDETELVIGGSRDDYKVPGQLALRAVFVARRAAPAFQSYSIETMLSLQDRRSTMAPTRGCLDAMRVDVIARLRPIIAKQDHERAVELASKIGGGGGSGGFGLGNMMATLNPSNYPVGQRVLWDMLKPELPKIEWSGILTADATRAYADAVAREVARTLQPGHSSLDFTPPPPPPTLASELGDFKRYGVAGIVNGQARQWISQATIDQMVKDGDLEALSKVPQGRDLLSASTRGQG